MIQKINSKKKYKRYHFSDRILQENHKNSNRMIGIRVKLIGAFIIPVLFIVAVGIISYYKASSGIVKNYESAVQETIHATGSYFNLGFKSISATAQQLAVDENLKDPKEYGAYKGVHKSIIANLAADDMMSNIHIFSVDGVGISTKESKQIQNIIKTIQARTSETVISARKSENIVASQSDALDRTVRLFHHIHHSVEELAVTMNKITREAGDIEKAKDETLGAMENISSVIQQTTAATEEISATANKQLFSVQKLNEAVMELKNEAVTLDGAVSVFVV